MLDVSALPTIDPVSAAVVNAMARAHWGFAIAEDEREGAVSPSLVFGLTEAQSVEIGDVEIRLSGRFGAVTVAVGTGLIDALSDRILPAWRQEHPQRLPLRWRAVLIATHLVGLTAMDSAITDIACSIVGARRTHCPCATRLSGGVAFGGRSWPVCLRLDMDAGASTVTLSSAIVHLPRRGPDPDFACLITAGTRRLSLADYRGLCRGDVVVVSRCTAGSIPLWGAIDGVARLSLLAAPDGVLTIRSVNSNGCGPMGSQDTHFPPDDAPASPFQNDPADEPPDAPDDEELPLPDIDDPVADLPVTLDFRLGTRRVTLAEVRALAPGAVLDLEINLADPLAILANGSVIGRGHLIQVGDHIGVQITHWPAAREADDG